MLSSVFFVLCLVNSSSAKKGLRAARNSSLNFPAVYTATIPAPGRESEIDPNEVYFASEVDVLDIIETGLPSAYDALGDDFVKISFIVHDEFQLDHLRQLVKRTPRSSDQAHNPSHPSSMDIDLSLTQDLHDQIYHFEDDSKRSQRYPTIDDYSCYKNLKRTFEWMQSMVERATSIPNLSVTTEDIGDSYLKTQNENNGYDIIAMKVTGNGVAAAGRTTEKGVLFLMTGIHARELAPPELVSRWIENMIDGYGIDAEKTAILDHTEIHVVLQSNPDGRDVVEKNLNTYRRKSLNPNGEGCSDESKGVDLNRNFPFQWGLNSGSSSNKCSETYRGPSPGSEPEVQAIMSYCQSIFPTDQRKPRPEEQIMEPYGEDAKGIFFDIHSYGEIIIYPWGHENKKTGNDGNFKALVNKFKYFNNYGFSGPLNGFSYPASGATDDWAYGTLGALGMTFELGTSFYQNCEYFLEKIIPDNFPAFTYAAKSSTAPYSIPKGPDITNTIIRVDGNLLTITATASDSAYAADSYPTSQQNINEVRAFVDIHPYDEQNGQSPTGNVFNGKSITIDISDLSVGQHTVYIQATDSDGYIGPVTASFFVKEDAGPTPTPECRDSTTELFRVDIIEMDHDCSWLSMNVGSLGRFDYLCELLEVAAICPSTCNKCAVFS